VNDGCARKSNFIEAHPTSSVVPVTCPVSKSSDGRLAGAKALRILCGKKDRMGRDSSGFGLPVVKHNYL
jgi:hypothetical protein